MGFRASHRVSALKLDHKTREAQRMAKFFSLLFKPFPPLGSHSVSYALFTPLLFLTADIKSNEKVGAHISISRGDAGAIRARQQLRPAPSTWRGSVSVAAPLPGTTGRYCSSCSSLMLQSWELQSSEGRTEGLQAWTPKKNQMLKSGFVSSSQRTDRINAAAAAAAGGNCSLKDQMKTIAANLSAAVLVTNK